MIYPHRYTATDIQIAVVEDEKRPYRWAHKEEAMEFTEQEITLALTPYASKDAPRSIRAHVCGALAYHPSIQVDDYWSITHVPTGRSIADIIPTEDSAQAIIGLALASDIDWGQADPDFIRHLDYRDRAAKLSSAIINHLGR